MSKGDLTRQRIIAEAAPIFNQRGYAGCSMQDIMQATGLEKGGLYRHFSSKEELATEAFRYALGNAVKLRAQSLAEFDNAVDKLRCTVRHFVEKPSTTPGGCVLMNTAIDADDGNPVLRDLALQGIQDWKGRIATIVEEGIRHKQIRKKTDPRQVANTIIATLEGALMISRLEGTRDALRDAQQSLNTLFDRIVADEPAKSAKHSSLAIH